jgi:hypothetical protein
MSENEVAFTVVIDGERLIVRRQRGALYAVPGVGRATLETWRSLARNGNGTRAQQQAANQILAHLDRENNPQ